MRNLLSVERVFWRAVFTRARASAHRGTRTYLLLTLKGYEFGIRYVVMIVRPSTRRHLRRQHVVIVLPYGARPL